MVYKDELLGIIKELHILTNSSKCDSKIAGELKKNRSISDESEL